MYLPAHVLLNKKTFLLVTSKFCRVFTVFLFQERAISASYFRYIHVARPK